MNLISGFERDRITEKMHKRSPEAVSFYVKIASTHKFSELELAGCKMNTIMGQKLGGRYQICQQIGKGGFSVTFLAEDIQRPRNPQCVVKQFQPMSTDPYTLKEARRLFDKEAEILETLGNHDNIPRLLAHFEENQEFYLVQEYIEGHDLSNELLPGKKLSEPYVFKLLQDILEILIFVHQQGVIHRDIKPSNIIRQRDGKIVLTLGQSSKLVLK